MRPCSLTRYYNRFSQVVHAPQRQVHAAQRQFMPLSDRFMPLSDRFMPLSDSDFVSHQIVYSDLRKVQGSIPKPKVS